MKTLMVDLFKENYENIFIVDAIKNKNYTFLDCHKLILQSCKFLENLKLKSQDKVVVVSDNNFDTVVLYFALLYKNIILIPINGKSTQEEFDYIVNSVKPKKIFSTQTKFNLNCNTTLFTEFSINKLKKDESFDQEPFYDFNEDDITLITYSSGTTGVPKGIMHKFSTLYNNARLFNTVMGINNNNRFFNILSLSYLGGYYNLLMLPFSVNASVVLFKYFDVSHLQEWPEIISKYNVNTLWLVPSIVSIMNQFDKNNEVYKREVDLVLVGTAPLSEVARNNFESKYKLTLYENYGLSETLFISTQSPLEQNDFNSKGKLLPNIELFEEEDGELVVKTPFRANGYFIENKDSLNFIENNIFKTGDIGYLKDNNVFIKDRKKDIIIRGGENISSVEIENFLLNYENVLDVAVIGVEHELYGEDIVSFIVSNDNFDLKGLRKYCSKNLNSKKVPSKYIQLKEIPKNKSGKKDKNKLREILRSEYGYK